MAEGTYGTGEALSQTGESSVDMPRGANWREYGACKGLEPDIFYPEDDADAGLAKEICESCNVRVACLEYALQVREKQGIWGGATERERRRIIRQRRRSA